MRTNTAGRTEPKADARFAELSPLGRVDGFGERFLTTDTDGTPVELLRFRAELSATAGFEDALRTRVSLLAAFDHAGVARAREVTHEQGRLALVSTRVEGQRLTEFTGGTLPPRVRPAFVARLLRDATRALAALEAAGTDVTHGVLTADRIVVSRDGEVTLTEYVLAPALEQMALWPEELWLQFGLLAPADEDGRAVFDRRTSVMQLAGIALAVLVNRQVNLHDFEARLRPLIEEAATLATTAGSSLAGPLRTWLTRALQPDAQAYESALEAETDLKKLLAAAGASATAEMNAPFPPVKTRAPRQREPEAVPQPAPAGAAISASAGTSASLNTGTTTPPASTPGAVSTVEPFAPARSSWSRLSLAVAAVLAIVAIGEAVAIVQLLGRKPAAVPVEAAVLIESPQAGDMVMVDGKTVGATPLRLRVTPQMQAIRLMPTPAATPAAPAVVQATADQSAALLEQAAARQRSGGVRFSTPIELKVLQGDRVLGSTADGPIVTTAGTHQLDLVNTALGYRTRQTVTVRAGVITPITVTPPMGRISINAQPWAQVLIDNTPVGETPLANIPAALGDHEVVFRHPQLGERRERVTVRADTPARVSTTFSRQ